MSRNASKNISKKTARPARTVVVDGVKVDVKYIDEAKLAKKLAKDAEQAESNSRMGHIKALLIAIETLQNKKNSEKDAILRSQIRYEEYETIEELWAYLNENYEVVHQRERLHKTIDLKAVQMVRDIGGMIGTWVEKDGMVTKYLNLKDPNGTFYSHVTSAEDFKLQNQCIAILGRAEVQIAKWLTNHSSLALELEAQLAMHSGERVDDDEVVHFGEDGELVEETAVPVAPRRSARIAEREAARAKPGRPLSEEALKELDEVVEAEWHKRNPKCSAQTC